MKYLNYVLGFIGVVVSFLVFVFMFLILYVVIVSPSCAERGGVQVPNGMVIINVMIGKVMVPQITQAYKCVIP